ncbi:phosphate regulon sensor histidine kinase PhoR [Ramlibacter sp. H39-3-26]|uniref:phosphate regulon sensor histidine kinase PhoR n=1 Tax=Curvibacter soli TaxID=3031331 RepID=UPI0023DAC017|nr:phosphate regulon sensor histidine kinase PhoR [Ramlibacter sp. H39-3-26]MDF1483818.1 phosphate regulon sensor histidine kinase PhoR [Ramlibacter sp. H39-3-26]
MAARILAFLLCMCVGAVLGAALGRVWEACAGAAAGAALWFVWDTLCALRVLLWLRQGADPAQAPSLRGAWGEAADRMRSQMRRCIQQIDESRGRLEEFLSALQASPSGVVLLDSENRIEWCNHTAVEHFGFDAGRDVLQPIGNLLRDPVFTAYQAARDFRHDVVLTGPASTAGRTVRLSVQLHSYGQGRKLLLSRDVTALEQVEAMRRDFVANVSHEIRTPLTVLMGFIETLQTLPLDTGERTRYLALMAQQASRMQTVVSDLLTLSRLEGSPLPGVAEWTPVRHLLQRCEEEARALSALLGRDAARHQSITFPSAEALQAAGEIAGAQGELQSALSNLVNNAVRYTPAGGAIDVRWARLPDGCAEFSVHDTGPGIAPEHIPRLTERFYRVDRSRSRETGGTGLGLAIVKHVVQRHGAALRIESTPGAGSTFAVVFPAARLRGL